MLKNELMTKWIGALRSGEYEQGQGNLRGGYASNEYCCLGVLCDLVDHDGWEVTDDSADLFHGAFDFPPDDVLELVGLTSSDARQLAGFNDDEGYRFEDIANFLEFGTELPGCDCGTCTCTCEACQR